MKRISLLILCAVLLSTIQASDLKLRYLRPASDWMNEALPIGNGYMGAMFFGGVITDEIQISEESIWSGGPGSVPQHNYGNKPDSWKYLAQIRNLLTEGKTDEALSLAQKHMTGQLNQAAESGQYGDYGAQQPFGSLRVTPILKDSAFSGYQRSLDLSQAIGSASYTRSGIDFAQEYFASYPARLVVARYTNDAPDGVDYQLELSTPHAKFKTSVKGNKIRVSGPLVSNGMFVEGEIYVKTDGRLSKSKNGITVRGAHYLETYVTVATDYKNEYPHYRGGDYRSINDRAMATAKATDYETMKAAHIRDHKSLFDRVSFSLGESAQSELPTDERLYQYSIGAYDPSLETLYFQYGRYLLIASSRPGSLPAHLQGKWNNMMSPPWSCDYHMNINLQMIYWPAEVTNLSECHTPLLEYINTLRIPGRQTAKDYFNARGWSVHTMNNPLGYTAPGWDYEWGYAPNGAAWLCDHLWKHFSYTRDLDYLQDFAYPVMKEVGQFWLDYLCEDTDGTLVSSPSYSPEHGTIGIGATIDQEIAWDLFSNLISAGDWVADDQAFLDSIRIARDRLSPLKIGRYGQLQEWKEDLDDPSSSHRHVSHLYAVYPGKQISPQLTPELADAAKRSLVYRGEEGTGWSLGWKINFWARFLDGNQSYKMIRNLLTPAVGKGMRPSGAGSYSNLLCSHPPFQIDGNLGAVSGMAEMLLQSQHGFLDILPALPAAWPSGAITGLKTEGGYTVDIRWKDGLLQELVIESPTAALLMIRYKGKDFPVSFTNPGKMTISGKSLLESL